MIDKINTSCKECVFAIYTDITQTDCKCGELGKMRDHNVEIVEAFDAEKEFYIINKTKCLYHRTKGWPLAESDLNAQIAHIKKCIEIKYDVIIIANNEIEDIKKTINSALQQTLKPAHITVLRKHTSTIRPTELYEICKDISIPWRVENCLKPGTDEECIDLVVPFLKTTVYSVFYAGFEIPPKVFEQINYSLHENFLRFTILLPNSAGNGMIVPIFIHTCYQGNYEKPLLQKLKDDECPFLIPIRQAAPSFPE